MLPNVQTHPSPELPAELKVLSTSLAKFTRNLVAAVPSNQREALSVLPSLVLHPGARADALLINLSLSLILAAANRVFETLSIITRLLPRYRTPSVSPVLCLPAPSSERLVAYPVTRMLVQALSNMVTANDSLASELWSNYLSLPDEHNILMWVPPVSMPLAILTMIHVAVYSRPLTPARSHPHSSSY